MFRHPENEYDWLSSDAAVDEVLLINEYTFTEAGLRADIPGVLAVFAERRKDSFGPYVRLMSVTLN